MTAECPVCQEPLPEPRPKGRPRIYCSKVCTERARNRVKQAAGLLDYADRVEENIGKPGFGSEEYLRARPAELRAMAAERLEGLPAYAVRAAHQRTARLRTDWLLEA